MLRLTTLLLICSLSISVSAQSDSSAVYLQKGKEESLKGRQMEAFKNFEKAYSYNSKSIPVVRELAASTLALRKYPQAYEKYRLLESLGERTDSTYRQLMLLSFNMKKFDEVINWANFLKKVSPSSKTAFYIGKAYYQLEDYGGAIKQLDVASKEDPSNPEIPYMVARAYTDMQNYKLAITYWQKAVALDPQQSRWLYELALVYYAMNDDQNSLKYMLEAADKGYRKDMEFQNNLATAYLNAGKVDEGARILKELIQKRPYDKELKNSLAEAYYNAKKYDEAIVHYDDLLRADNSNAEALYMIGMSYQKKGEKQKGMALCDKAIEMDPSLTNLRQKKELPNAF